MKYEAFIDNSEGYAAGVKIMSILILGKDREDCYFRKAMEFVTQNFEDYKIILAKQGEKLPDEVKKWQGDYLVSYLCPWVIPAEVLESTKIANINFHPGPPDYPGSGCTNFALYNQEQEYGVTCHYMASVVDLGKNHSGKTISHS